MKKKHIKQPIFTTIIERSLKYRRRYRRKKNAKKKHKKREYDDTDDTDDIIGTKNISATKAKFGCYACQEYELTNLNEKEAYKKHCIKQHPNGKITTRLIPLRSFENGEARLIRLPCPFCEFTDVKPTSIEGHIEAIHPEWIYSK